MRAEPIEGTRTRRAVTSLGAYLHTKAVVVDRKKAIIGSMNLDPRSRQYNTEIAIFLDSAELGARLGALFDEAAQPLHAFHVELATPGGQDAQLLWITEEHGETVRYEHEPAGLWRRFFSRVLGLLAPENLL